MSRVITHPAARAWLFGTALLALAAHGAQAQQAPVTERTSPHLRNDCRLAAQVLTTGHPQPHSDWALETIGRCEESAGPALAALWSTPPADSTALEQLFRASARVRDGRVLDAVSRLAEDGGRPSSARLAALRVLAAYVDPAVVAPVAFLTDPDPRNYRVASQADAVQIDGAVPTGDVREPLRDLLHRLASDHDDALRSAAAYLVRRLAID